MKFLLSILCIYLCLTIGSMEKLKSDIKETVKKEIDSKKEIVSAKEISVTEKTSNMEKTLDTEKPSSTKKSLDTEKSLDTKSLDSEKSLGTEKSLDTEKPSSTKKSLDTEKTSNTVNADTEKTSNTKKTLDTEKTFDTKDTADTKKKEEPKGEVKAKENIETTGNKDKKEIGNKSKYHYKRKTYATKEDIPKDYLEFLKKRYNIVEDPVGDYERKLAAYDLYDDYDYTYDEGELYDEYPDKKDSEEVLTETEKVIETDDNKNETEEKCKVCKVLEADKNLRLATIQSTILDRIGFSMNHLPNMTGKTIPKIPSLQKLIEQHEMLADAPYTNDDDYLPEDEYYGQVKRAYTIAQKPPEDFEINVRGGCYFDLPESVTSRKVKDASLWIYLEPSAFERKPVVEIYIYVVPQKAKPQHILKGPMRYKKSSASGWIEFKFAHIVHHWIKQPAANKGLVIQALDEDGNNHVVTPGKHSDNTYIPMLEMSTVEHRDGHHRKKRSINHVCTEQERIETCCRYPLRVDFVQFGWDWVIAPTGYMANYCSGECRYRHMENNPQAYLIQQTPDGSGPCCTPSKFFPLAMLYFDHAHTVLYTYMQKMIVERCGCA